MRSDARHDIELNACGPEDPDGHRAASVLAAYFTAERTRAFRRLLWRRLAAGALIAWAIEATTPFLPRSGLVVTLLAFGAAAAVAAVAEWRAENALRALTQGLRKVDRQAHAD